MPCGFTGSMVLSSFLYSRLCGYVVLSLVMIACCCPCLRAWVVVAATGKGPSLIVGQGCHISAKNTHSCLLPQDCSCLLARFECGSVHVHCAMRSVLSN